MKQQAITILFVFVIGIILFSVVHAQKQEIRNSEAATKVDDERIIEKYDLDQLVIEIESSHCNLSDEALQQQGLKPAKIEEVRQICSKSIEEKLEWLINLFIEKEQNPTGKSQITGYGGSYTCLYSGFNTVPTQGDLGLTSSQCTWHDTSPQSCRVQAGQACMWGCTRNDPLLGFHTQTFSSTASLLTTIVPIGYSMVTNPSYGTGYRRTLPYGYSYELSVQSTNPNGSTVWHSEGPEPDPRFNWYGSVNGTWPFEVGVWHAIC